ncbi:MAG: hypothetical protein K2K92_08195 [Duncaniella sp.]|nr:hypothetical protein [Duncaniella sp.]
MPLLLAGCVNDSYDELVPPSEASPKADIMLDLDVSVLGNSVPAAAYGLESRAFDIADDGDFEPGTKYEGLSTLRVIIVRNGALESTAAADPDLAAELNRHIGEIEHNRMVSIDENGVILYDNLSFHVIGGEKKRIYLFGNEDAKDHPLNGDLTPLISYDFDALTAGKLFPADEVADVMITRRPNSSVIDNSSYIPQYVPMSEVFDVNVARSTASVSSQREVLFITRSLIKFSLCVISNSPFPASKSMLNGIRIDGISNECYYLPRDTEYAPGKYTISSNKLQGRYITEFTLPADHGTSSYYFPVRMNLRTPGEYLYSGNGMIYFPESKGTYKVSLDFADPWYNEHTGTKDLELQNIPRNTHVKINVYINGQDITTTITLLPYTGVYLNPSFGFPRDPETN